MNYTKPGGQSFWPSHKWRGRREPYINDIYIHMGTGIKPQWKIVHLNCSSYSHHWRRSISEHRLRLHPRAYTWSNTEPSSGRRCLLPSSPLFPGIQYRYIHSFSNHSRSQLNVSAIVGKNDSTRVFKILASSAPSKCGPPAIITVPMPTCGTFHTPMALPSLLPSTCLR